MVCLFALEPLRVKRRSALLFSRDCTCKRLMKLVRGPKMKPAWLMSVVRVDKHDTGLLRRRLCGHGGKATDESQCGACTALSCEELRKIVQRQKHLSHLLVVCGGNVGSFGP